MSCRKYEAPRHGSLAYCPKKRAKQIRQPAAAAPPDNPADKPHLTSFLAYKAGMTHILRITTRKSNDKKAREIRKEVVDAVSVLEAPAMRVYGIRVYTRGVRGLVLADEYVTKNKSECLLARMVRRYHRSALKKNAGRENVQEDLNDVRARFEKYCATSNVLVKVLMHTKIETLKLDSKKAHVLEVQVNGGSVADKVQYALSVLNTDISIGEVFNEQELISICGVTKGKGFTGVVKRFGVRILPRKSNKGIRKVACIGAWHPAGVLRTVARAGQMGCFKRTLINKKVLKIGNATQSVQTEFDLTDKTINPLGGFVNYGMVKNDYLMVKGPCVGPVKRVVTLCKSYTGSRKLRNTEDIDIKFIDTSSKMGHGRFQTVEEKAAYYSK
ncbi:60S ribosomal protein L3 [Trachipleistophora hominis]|uniref:60S ribosomal protein L3 n=1 Tax=Trachipleistophora hominis TaxID=72359 RepID=L7JWZ5_TRAHO|nr:60S ribosomal protein L3 [Trachipleistophora hominis]